MGEVWLVMDGKYMILYSVIMLYVRGNLARWWWKFMSGLLEPSALTLTQHLNPNRSLGRRYELGVRRLAHVCVVERITLDVLNFESIDGYVSAHRHAATCLKWLWAAEPRNCWLWTTCGWENGKICSEIWWMACVIMRLNRKIREWRSKKSNFSAIVAILLNCCKHKIFDESLNNLVLMEILIFSLTVI